ncbi:type IV secretion system protein VirB6 [Bartonella fuyuanensis]|uniref:Type IV secretion system protein VirB6 n=1 Tax=Bartonella fuyuanensis TaxID=1460968 RepID=A0A840DRU1_9HYPH|nr:type IV secretion system protein [Bartonella fuyuanensis]MBB4075784.1 type IV secretion system protein VirB6 [Bartonella fuyuanensis]MBB4075788.1 type IV secretion system protein VirB6 [Bartonella fuyuanensis]
MNFTMFTQLVSRIDEATKTYVTDISSKAIAIITPFVSVGLTISFIVYGLLIMRGAIDMSLSGFVHRYLRTSIITSIALSTGLYQTEIANLIIDIPYELAAKLMNNPPNNNTLISLIDKVAEQGFSCASEAFEEAAFLEANGLLYGLFGILILLITSFLAAIGGAFILMAKIALVLLVGLGPLFIIALLWQPTYRFFEQWIAQILSYTILVVLLATVFSLMMDIFANYVTDLKFDGKQNVGYALGGALILSIISIVLLLKLSNIANALAKGVTFRYLWRLDTTGNASPPK